LQGVQNPNKWKYIMSRLSNKLKYQLLFITVAIVALGVRGTLLTFWLNTPFRYYSTVSGLDMKTLLELGSLFYHGKSTFALYSLLIAGIMQFNNGIISVTALIITQQLLGIITSLLITWICLKLTGKKAMALVAGLIAALYAPALIYEAITLRESLFAFTAILSLAILLKLHQKKFSYRWLFITGIIITLPLTVRLSALLWLGTAIFTVKWLLLKKISQPKTIKTVFCKTFKPMAVLLSGVLVVIIAVAIINFRQSGAVTPISQRYIKYIFTLGRQVNPQTVNIHLPDSSMATQTQQSPATISTSGIAYVINCFNKFGKLFNQYEIPNNVNYYFMREQLFPCAILPGPGLMIPLAVAGLVLLIIRGRFRHRELILILYILAFALPITIFLPLGRYRLILYPVFSIIMLYPFQLIFSYIQEFKKSTLLPCKTGETDEVNSKITTRPQINQLIGRKKSASLKIFGIIFLIGTIYIFTLPKHTKFRASDFTTHGKAFQQQAGAAINSENCFAMAYQLNPTAPAVAINYTDILLKRGKAKQALQTIAPAWKQHPQHAGVALFTSSALLCNAMPKQATAVLLKAGAPTAPAGQRLYYYNLSESYRMQGKNQQAKQAYSKFRQLQTTISNNN
jgi:4-amino-4-deoxy-L-arabinose transferase-like glycosyltransferase